MKQILMNLLVKIILVSEKKKEMPRIGGEDGDGKWILGRDDVNCFTFMSIILSICLFLIFIGKGFTLGWYSIPAYIFYKGVFDPIQPSQKFSNFFMRAEHKWNNFKNSTMEKVKAATEEEKAKK